MRKPGFGLLGAALFFALTAAAQAPSGAKLDELMDKSGVSDQIATVSKNLLAPGRYDDKLSTAQRTAVHTAKEQGFSAQVLRTRYRDSIAKRVTASDADAVLRWLDSDTGRTLIRLEQEDRKAGGPSDSDAAKRLLSVVGSDRRERLERIAQASGAGERTVKLVLDLSLASAEIYAALSGHHTEVEDIKRRFAAEHGTLVQRAYEGALARDNYLYRSVSLEGLDKYVAFLESPSGKRYVNASSDAFAEAIVAAANDTAKYLAAHKPPPS